MTKESARKFLEDVKKNLPVQDIRRNLNEGRIQVGIVNYLTEEANQMGYDFTVIELEEVLFPWLLSAQELLEKQPESIENSEEQLEFIQELVEQPESIENSEEQLELIQEPVEQPESIENAEEQLEFIQEPVEQAESIENSEEQLELIQEPVEQPELTNKSEENLANMAIRKLIKPSPLVSRKSSANVHKKVSKKVSTDNQSTVSEEIVTEVPLTPASTIEMLSSIIVSNPKESPSTTMKNTALKKVVEKMQQGNISGLNGRIWA